MELATSCVLDCPDRCALRCRVEARSVRLRGDPEHPYTRGFTCEKIRRYPARLASPHRIREPWLRKGDHFVPASWDEALDLVCGALDRARGESPEAVLAVRGAGSMGLSKGFADYAFGFLGARGTEGSLCDAAGIAGLEADAGALRMNDPLEIDRAEAVVLWGKDPRASSVHAAAQVAEARRRGVPVVAVNPDGAAARGLADRLIVPRPGSDRFLALAVAKILLADPARPPPWDRAAGRADYEALLARRPLEALLDACGVAEPDARALAHLYRRTPRVGTIVGWGVQRHPFGAENLRAIHAVAFLAGSLGIPGGGLYYSTPSSRHARRPRPPGPAGRPLRVAALGRDLAQARPAVRFAWVAGSNLLNQGPDAKAAREAFRRIETSVVVEPFWTETARAARVVLPPALWLEEEDVAASYWHRGLGAARRVLDPPEGCRTDFEIMREVMGRIGVETGYGDVDSWLAACLPAPGPTLAELREKGWWLCDEPAVAWEEGFAHPDGRFRLLAGLSPELPVDSRHPLRFLTLVRRDALHSQMLPEEQMGPLPVRLHPQTAERLGAPPGCAVRVVSAVGEVEAEVHLDPGLHPEAAACPRGGWLSLGLGVNEVTEPLLTDQGLGAAYYGTRVRVEKIAR